jgi:rhamnosyltransferase
MLIPRIAILLAAYNGEKWIERQIETILNQKGGDLDLYVSVDLSIDNTYKIVHELSKKNENIIILPYGKKFGKAASNFYRLFLEVPTGKYDYIALSDQDDIWLSNKLEKAINILEDQEVFGYSSNVVAFWQNGRKKLIKKSFQQREYDYLFEAPGPGCTFVLKKELVADFVRHLSKKNESQIDIDLHDWLIYAYARSKNYKWIIDKRSYINYRQHANNQVGANVGFKAFISRMKLMMSGYGIIQSIKTIKYLNLENNLFVCEWYKRGKLNLCVLAFHARKCRRSRRDQIYFFFICILIFLCLTLKINKNMLLSNTQYSGS